MEFTTENYTFWAFRFREISQKWTSSTRKHCLCRANLYNLTVFSLKNLGSLLFFYLKDYPSVGQILQKARENNINVIFVIGGANNKLVRSLYYDKLAALLPGGFNNASELTTDASNILDIVGNSYRVNHFRFSN